MDEPSSLAPVAKPIVGFSCPGPMYFPGLLAIPAVHIGVLYAALWWAKAVGPSWLLAGVAVGGLAAFWLVFLIAARWIGDRGTVINMLGFALIMLTWGGLVVAAVWWLVRAVQTLY